MTLKYILESVVINLIMSIVIVLSVNMLSLCYAECRNTYPH
jgi:hypothetical protein